MDSKDAQVLADVIENAAGIKLSVEEAKTVAAMFKVLESAGHEGLKEMRKAINNCNSYALGATMPAALCSTVAMFSQRYGIKQRDLALEIIEVFGKKRKKEK